jgi:glycosyltransferase involved in cell wall biosynthesis
MTEGTTLAFVTESYPYAAAVEDTFVEPELPYLRAAFESVVLIPTRMEGSRATPPADIEIDDDLARFLSDNSARFWLIARALISRLFWRDVISRPALLSSPRALRRLVGTVAKAELTKVWFGRWLQSRSLDPAQVVAYTFWCDQATVGLALLGSRRPDLVVVSRAHGSDLYAERHEPPYLPCRSFTLAHLVRLFPDSERGARYVSERYPSFAARCEVSRMGVRDPGFLTKGSPRGRCSLVSCSLIVPIKRVDLILKGLTRAAQLRPDIKFSWHHFGDGPLKAALEEEARTGLPDNAKAHFPGYPGLADLMRFYETQPVDAFLNASVSEGTPVAIMEAASCGIPLIATAVGGNPEIVSPTNGALLSANPSPDEVAGALLALIQDREGNAALRDASRRVWRTKYNAATTYAAFAQRLVELRAGGGNSLS